MKLTKALAGLLLGTSLLAASQALAGELDGIFEAIAKDATQP